jgi:hypothetical protein
MPPKRKAVEDTRSPLEIAIAANEEQIRVCEQQVSQFRDGVQDLAVHTVKIKTLEQDVVPKEAELKTIMANFNKLLENSVVMSKLRGAADGDAAGASNRLPSRAASRAGAATPLPPVSPTVDDVTDREALRLLSNIMRDQLTAIVVPLFQTERTHLEQLAEEAKEREATEAAAAAAAAAVAAASGSTVVPPVAAVPAPKAAPKPGVGAAGAKGVPAALMSSAELAEKVDLELYRPPGLDVHLVQDVLKLRTQRIACERQLKSLQHQLSHSRQLVARRTNEGASKAALKKAEKTLAALQQNLRDLQRQRDETDRKKSETPHPGVAAKLAKAAAAPKR